MKRRPTDSRGRAGGAPQSFEALLKSDAARIRADVSPELDRRIEAAIVRERSRPATPGRRETFVRPWLAGSLVGVGVAATAVLLIGRMIDAPDAPAPAPTPAVSIADSAPEYLQAFREQVPLNVETAELTAPLEQELRNLQSDLEKAREDVERDLRLTF